MASVSMSRSGPWQAGDDDLARREWRPVNGVFDVARSIVTRAARKETAVFHRRYWQSRLGKNAKVATAGNPRLRKDTARWTIFGPRAKRAGPG